MRDLLVLAFVCAVACATPYQQRGMRGGYEDTQLDQNLFRISFEANTGPGEASDYALLRSAEVTLEHGFAFFVVTSSESAAKVVGGKHAIGTMNTSINTIACFEQRPSDQPSVVYDAAAVRSAIRTKYEIR
jgi:hypothetical protein